MNTERTTHATLLTALCWVALAATARLAGAQDREVDAFLQTQVQARGIPGVSIAVVRDGQIVLAKGYGMANLERATPATEGTVYQLASVTKQFTATAVMMLVQEGKLALDARITDVLPGLPAGWSDVTIEHLLNHTSGIRSYTSLPGFAEDRSRSYRHEEVIALVADAPRDFSAGQAWSYNNTGYYLLGMVIEKVSGADYGAFLHERIFAPLGMSTARLNDAGRPAPGLAQGYAPGPDGVLAAPSVDPTQPFAAGALVATVLDLARWDAALYTDRLLPPAVFERMWSPTRLAGGATHGYGFGWEVGEFRGRPRIAHGGGIPGFQTFVARYPEERLSVIVLANQEGAGADLLANAIATFYIPALQSEGPRPIEDADPATTQRLREITMRLAGGSAEPDWFTEEARAFFFPDRIREGARLGALGELGAFELMEVSTEGEAARRHYRAHFGATPMRITYVLGAEGKISGIQLRPDELR